MRALTTKAEREIEMKQLRPVRQIEKIVFPLTVLIVCALLLPSATPLVGMLMLGNLFKECGVVERLSKTAANELINIVTIMLGLAVGSKLQADTFLSTETLGIIVLGLIAFGIGTASGVIMAKIMSAVAAIALVLALAGVYGVMGYSVAQRRRELGIRMALGAQDGDVVRMILRQGTILAVIGTAFGVGLAFGVARGVSFFLYGVSAFEPATYGTMAAALLIAALVATFFPARRATRVDPVEALRAD
ncbi:MAG: sodium ion-translocating decarboxylase subunit beta, partial [Gemmatimonadales bacterium]